MPRDLAIAAGLEFLEVLVQVPVEGEYRAVPALFCPPRENRAAPVRALAQDALDAVVDRPGVYLWELRGPWPSAPGVTEVEVEGGVVWKGLNPRSETSNGEPFAKQGLLLRLRRQRSVLVEVEVAASGNHQVMVLGAS